MYSAYKLNKQGDNTALTYSFPNLEPVCCSKFGSKYCFLTCIQISQEQGKVVWYFHLLKNFPQFVVIHRVKGFGILLPKNVFLLLFSVVPLQSEKAMAPHSSTLAQKIPWTEEPGGLLSIGSHRVRHDWSDLACMHTPHTLAPPQRKTPESKRSSFFLLLQ